MPILPRVICFFLALKTRQSRNTSSPPATCTTSANIVERDKTVHMLWYSNKLCSGHCAPLHMPGAKGGRLKQESATLYTGFRV